eukprot:gnl/TRDRNA2_/TRDRNA2_159203_c1_seq1.p1 gnl/TRDRNA2_/TRDRNA2_159203_c1~~gnl/TRDRNA2_/TRDRNA2_159203_c1_seq1.p1  ORF type:complete len:680 (+),score=194.09 gnl/TRDRNA2_/TRDRNA2_159203_c1_seq1:93-2042(+)
MVPAQEPDDESAPAEVLALQKAEQPSEALIIIKAALDEYDHLAKDIEQRRNDIETYQDAYQKVHDFCHSDDDDAFLDDHTLCIVRDIRRMMHEDEVARTGLEDDGRAMVEEIEEECVQLKTKIDHLERDMRLEKRMHEKKEENQAERAKVQRLLGHEVEEEGEEDASRSKKKSISQETDPSSSSAASDDGKTAPSDAKPLNADCELEPHSEERRGTQSGARKSVLSITVSKRASVHVSHRRASWESIPEEEDMSIREVFERRQAIIKEQVRKMEPLCQGFDVLEATATKAQGELESALQRFNETSTLAQEWLLMGDDLPKAEPVTPLSFGIEILPEYDQSKDHDQERVFRKDMDELEQRVADLEHQVGKAKEETSRLTDEYNNLSRDIIIYNCDLDYMVPRHAEVMEELSRNPEVDDSFEQMRMSKLIQEKEQCEKETRTAMERQEHTEKLVQELEQQFEVVKGRAAQVVEAKRMQVQKEIDAVQRKLPIAESSKAQVAEAQKEAQAAADAKAAEEAQAEADRLAAEAAKENASEEAKAKARAAAADAAKARAKANASKQSAASAKEAAEAQAEHMAKMKAMAKAEMKAEAKAEKSVDGESAKVAQTVADTSSGKIEEEQGEPVRHKENPKPTTPPRKMTKKDVEAKLP